VDTYLVVGGQNSNDVEINIGEDAPMAFEISSPAFAAGAPIPVQFTCDGENVSPELRWSGAPDGTQSFTLIVDDPDAPVGVFNHWLLADIPANLNSIAEGFQVGQLGVSGNSDFKVPGYRGPCPPRRHGPHRYFFKFFAVDVPTLELAEGATRQAFDAALAGHVIEQAEYLGTYER
jgi:Raf kinase inhibitor-like YbhB/YbcL family protein